MTPSPDAGRHAVPREHPLWPAFKRWADENTPGLMLHLYWAAFLSGVVAARAADAADHSTPTPEDVE